MKNTFILFALAFILSSCGILKKSNRQDFKITVIDQVNGSPIQNAKVTLVAMVDARDVYREVNYTDDHGKCRFKTSYPNRAQFQIRATKGGYKSYLSLADEKIHNGQVFINEETGNDLTMHLTSDLLNHQKYFKAKVPRYSSDDLIEMLRSNQFPPQRSMPQLRWEDIPKLLSIGNDTTIINRY
ncbi:MAG: hypothetical protein GQ527_00355, partial [Bacteroidales bacterium]|nr:hypothetical protein [Bacteroidales bacterium]